MRIVLDANVVASGIFWSGPPNEILRRWLSGTETLLISMPILAEYREVLKRLAGDSDLTAHWNLLLAEMGEMVEPSRLAKLCRDPDDEKYIETAVGGAAQAIVSGDKYLLTLKTAYDIPIVSPRAFLSL